MLKIITGTIMLAVSLCGMHSSYADTAPSSNKQVATEFFEAVVNKKDFQSAEKYLGAWYTEHDPEGTDGANGLKSYIDFMKANFPNSHIEIKRVIADGDYVVFHVHSVLVPGTRGQAIIDMFRLDHGKVVEHWDITQEIPEKSANANGMF